MIIDCHGHYTTAPKQHEAWRQAQIEAHSKDVRVFSHLAR
jgi:4-oxalmesaconate hydratase